MMNAKFAKFALIPLALVAGSAFAVDADVEAKTAAQTVDYEVTAGKFVVTPFKFNVSANVALKSLENETAIAVATSNTKGRNQFTGTSEGGSVSQCGDPTTGSTPPGLDAPSLEEEKIKVNGCNR